MQIWMEYPGFLASGFDFVGIIIFIIVAVISALSKKFKEGQDTEDEPIKPVRRNRPPVLPEGSPVPDLAGEMKRFLEEMKKEVPKTPHHSPPTLPLPQKRYEEPKPRPIRVIPPPMVIEETEEEVTHGILSNVEVNLAQEITESQQAEQVLAKVRHDYNAFSLTPSDVEAKKRQRSFDISLLRNRSSLKQAIILTEVFGKPKCVVPYR